MPGKNTKFTDKQIDVLFEENCEILPDARTFGITLEKAVEIFGDDVINHVMNMKPKKRLPDSIVKDLIAGFPYYAILWECGEINARKTVFKTVSKHIDHDEGMTKKDRKRNAFFELDEGDRFVMHDKKRYITYTGLKTAQERYNYIYFMKPRMQKK